MPEHTVGIYEMDRRYGGAEEGGWWYDCGTLRRSYTVSGKERARELARRIDSLLAYRRKLYRWPNIGSVVYGGGHYAARIYEGPAPEHFPEQRPYYE